jgi:hypothetical protein
MVLREAPADAVEMVEKPKHPLPIALAVGISVTATLLLGTVLPLTQVVYSGANQATRIDDRRLIAK